MKRPRPLNKKTAKEKRRSRKYELPPPVVLMSGVLELRQEIESHPDLASLAETLACMNDVDLLILCNLAARKAQIETASGRPPEPDWPGIVHVGNAVLRGGKIRQAAREWAEQLQPDASAEVKEATARRIERKYRDSPRPDLVARLKRQKEAKETEAVLLAAKAQKDV